jgi:hypothetical protein
MKTERDTTKATAKDNIQVRMETIEIQRDNHCHKIRTWAPLNKASPPREPGISMSESPQNHTTAPPTPNPPTTPPPDTPPPNTPPTSTAHSQSQESQSLQWRSPALNTTNLRTNNTFGDIMQLPIILGISRFVSLNINGFRRLPRRL